MRVISNGFRDTSALKNQNRALSGVLCLSLDMDLLIGDTEAISEVQFNDYRPLAGGWIGAEVLFLQNRKRTMEEYYSDIKANVEIPDKVFDPMQWKGTRE